MCSNYISVELTDIVASLLSVGAMVAFLRVWQPGDAAGGRAAGARPARDRGRGHARRRPRGGGAPPRGHGPDSRGDIIGAYAPYLIIIVVFGLAQWGPIKDFLAKGAAEFTWPGLDILNAKGEAPTARRLQVQLAARRGHAAADLRPADDGGAADLARRAPCAPTARTLNQLKWATLTVAAVLGAGLRDEPVARRR